MKKPQYISKLEETQQMFSIMELGTIDKDLQVFFKDKKVTIVYSETKNKNGYLVWDEIIYKTSQSFYIHISHNKSDIDKWSMNIYYNPEQLNELIIYTNQLLKQIK
jgi:isocitrate/isopropylmalate dehydrogenase